MQRTRAVRRRRKVWHPAEEGEARLALTRPGMPSVKERVGGYQARDQDRDDVDHLDHRVDRRAGRVLEGVAHGVTGDRRLVGLGPLAAEVALLDPLLGVVPGGAAAGHV